MKKFMSALCAGSLSLSIGLVPIIPSAAAPMMPNIVGTSNVETVQYRDGWRKNNRSSQRDFRRDHRRGHWNGHRGHSNKRAGHRRHSDGMWYPLAAFGLGAIMGGAIANQPQPAPVYQPRGGNAHVQWCYDRYRSYRASDNTFQHYNGPRQQCYSPY